MSVAVWRGGYVGVGVLPGFGPGELLTSTDAVHWSAAASGPVTDIQAVSTAGSVLFAMGQREMWVSRDGQTWTPATIDGVGGIDARFVGRIIAGGPGFIAVGPIGPVHRYTGPAEGIWTSLDGITWDRIPDENVFREASLLDVTAGGPGYVASGSSPSLGGSGRSVAAVWTSPNGISWSRVSDQPLLDIRGRSASMNSVIETDTGLLGVGGAERPGDLSLRGETALVWTSPDGISWSRVRSTRQVFAHADIGGVTRAGAEFLAVGHHGSSPAIWTSLDGEAWTLVSNDFSCAASHMYSLTSGPVGMIAIAGNAGGTDCIWTTAPVIDR